ncbi:MAG: ribosome silencing factor [Frigidibacter sp.]|nr:ribosome silencing factor [Frigidibacter sp.]MDP3341562.1 ribosome silencing factor [Frigidibacter sp.]
MLLIRYCLAPGPDRRATQEDDVLSISLQAATAGAAGSVPMSALSQDVSSDVVLDRVLASLDDDKAEEVVSIDLRGRSSVADHMVICSGRSSRQVGSIAEKLVDRMKTEFGRVCKIEGKDQGDWVLIDVGDVVVHVFRPEVRDFYQLEKMWLPSNAAEFGVRQS